MSHRHRSPSTTSRDRLKKRPQTPLDFSRVAQYQLAPSVDEPLHHSHSASVNLRSEEESHGRAENPGTQKRSLSLNPRTTLLSKTLGQKREGDMALWDWSAVRRSETPRVLDIGGSGLDGTLLEQVKAAFQRQRSYPKEIGYRLAMKLWMEVAKSLYQTKEEMDIVRQIAAEVMAHFKGIDSEITIVDLGAAGSFKFQPFIDAGLQLGLKMVYMPLDIDYESLQRHVSDVAGKYPAIPILGLWGSFEQGDAYLEKKGAEMGPRLLLSCESIFYNAPGDIRRDRIEALSTFMTRDDRMIIGQDAPPQTDEEVKKVHDHYNSVENNNFMKRIMRELNHLGRKADGPTEVDDLWACNPIMSEDRTCYYYKVTAKRDTVLFDQVIPKGQSFELFKSWKPRFETIQDDHKRCTDKTGIPITVKPLRTAQQAGHVSGGTMIQFIVQRRELSAKKGPQSMY